MSNENYKTGGIVGVAIKHTNGNLYFMSSPASHRDLMSVMASNFKVFPANNDELGFIDDNVNFLDRIEALELAHTCGQTEKTEGTLSSDDLW